MSAMPNGRCRLHGGKSLAADQSPSLSAGGRYSKYLPQRLLPRYEESRQDPELIACREELSLIDTRMAELLGKVDLGESGQLWQFLQKLVVQYHQAKEQDRLGLLSLIFSTIEDGAQEYQTWEEIRQLVAERRRTAETETKRLHTLQMMVTAEQASILLLRVHAIIRQHVHDDRARAAIASEFTGLLSHEARENGRSSSPETDSSG